MPSLSFRFIARFRKTYEPETPPPGPEPVTITTTTLNNGVVGFPYSRQLLATGGTTPYTWSLVSGTLPTGLTLRSDGVIIGEPTTVQLRSFTVAVTDNDNVQDTQALSITVEAAPIASYPYYESLIQDPGLYATFHLRTQANIDSLQTGANNPGKLPTLYDSAHDAAAFRVDPSGQTSGPNTSVTFPNGSGSTDTQQKWHNYPTNLNGDSILWTYDAKLEGSLAFTSDPASIGNYKAYRWDTTATSSIWLAHKYFFSRGVGNGLAEVAFTNPGPSYLAPGTTTIGEVLKPQLTTFYIQPDVWTRFWVFAEGTFGSGIGGTPIQLSIWAADNSQGIVHLYDRLALYTPVEGLFRFRFEFDTSDETATFGLSRLWHRNYIVLTGMSLQDVQNILVKPTASGT